MRLLDLSDISPAVRDFFANVDWDKTTRAVSVFLPALLVVALGVLVVLLRNDRAFRTLTRRRIRELELPPSAAAVADALAALTARDPSFSIAALERHATTLLAVVVKPPGAVLELPLTQLSDALVRRILAQQLLDRAAGGAKRPAAVQIESVRTLGAFAERNFDAVHVLVGWRDRAAPDVVNSEVMVFVRRPHVPTRELRTDRCPNCAAPYAGGALNLCGACRVVLNSGEYGWVLTQQVAFEAYRGPWREFRGVDKLLARDPGFSPEVLEDRAALIFWRWVLARSGLDAKGLDRLADEAGREQLRARAAELAHRNERELAAEIALHGADIVSIHPSTDEGLDEVHVRVRWSGRFGAVATGWSGARIPISAQATVFTLVRDASALSDLRCGISTDRCANCAAALVEVLGEICSHCQTPFRARATDFVLRRAESWEGWLIAEGERAQLDAEVNPFVPTFKFVEERERLLRVMASVVAADGTVTPTERRLLHRCAEMWGVDPVRVRGWIERPEAEPNLALPKGSWVARAFVEALITAAAIDGHVDRHERKLLVRVAESLGVEAPSVYLLRSRASAAPRAS